MATLHQTRYDQKQLHRDRITLLMMVLLFAALAALIIWLASMGTIPAGEPWIAPMM